MRISAYPIHRMQNSRDFCMLHSKSNVLCKPQQKCEEFCSSALRCHWRKYYYQTQIYQELFFVGNPFKAPGLKGETCPGTIFLVHVLRESCARGSFDQTQFSHKTLYSGFPGEKKDKKRQFYDQSIYPKEQFSIRHITSLVHKQNTS